MNTRNDELEALLGTGLRERAGDVGGRSIGFEAVRGRARSIRRRRRTAAGVAVAAALAVAVPLSITAGGLPHTQEEIQPAPRPREVVRTTLTLDGLPRGEAPRVEYFVQDGVVLPDAGLQPLDSSLQALIPNAADGGWWALSPSKDEVLDLTDDFEQTSARTVTQAVVTTPDRSAIAWVFPEGGAQTMLARSATDPTEGRTWDFPERPDVQPVDFLGEGSVLYRTLTPRGDTREIGIAHEDGTTTTFDGDFLGVLSGSSEAGLAAVQTEAKADASGCYGVVDPAASTATTVWETCDYSLGAFSPDGRYVLASDSYQSGVGGTSLSVLDARTGGLVAEFRQPRGGRMQVWHAVWETADTVVAAANEGMATTVLRLRLDGSLEETIDRFEADPFGDLPIYLGYDRIRGL